MNGREHRHPRIDALPEPERRAGTRFLAHPCSHPAPEDDEPGTANGPAALVEAAAGRRAAGRRRSRR
jgi:hypothetical protein